MASLARMAGTLFPDSVGLGVVSIGAADDPWPEELPAIARAVPHRRNEFAAGRAAARMAMSGLGLELQAIPAGEDRAPIWPAGLTGSITHGEDTALAVVCKSNEFRGLGIDIEPDAPLPEDVLSDICDGDECAWIAGQVAPLRWARLIFVAKEAAFKCQYPATRAIFGFDVMTIRIMPQEGRLTARFTRDVSPYAAGDLLEGRFIRSAGMIVAGFVDPADPV
ncbi:4'-phosphopantetheinyl transferase superfamily protein [Paracoccus sp. Z330]|uniref:Enterobactin synthase component D n=1 Tax=Paracoccus onchidii TaxID=3017813 RepID=A0ABT4ZDU2_9RHOB|nr:4'-phosphopantetheinyl transferase superfamily protein [Paracoccus onchidii]MDB6176896.1 4'-phosphopantetheinyl transferase superfamily protein [Paracoccus onchidii]